MPSFLNVRVAPGVRLSASSRGLRTHVGPRAARVHVGGGGAGVSTGAGPFTYYRSLQQSPARGNAARRPSDAQAEKAAEAQRIAAQLQAIESLHRHEFTAPVRATAERPKLPSFGQLLEAAEREHLRGVGLFDRAARRAARQLARTDAEQHARIRLGRANAEQAERQRELDSAWQSLIDNDEDIVLAALEEAFEDNQAPAAAVGVDGDTASVVVLVPGPETLPERVPSTTLAGNLSLKKMTKSARASWYLSLVAGHVVATAREALAAAPGLAAVTVVAVRRAPLGGQPEVLLATTLDRRALASVHWQSVRAWEAVDSCGRDTRVRFKGVAREMAPLDLSGEPGLAGVALALEPASIGAAR